MKISRQNLFWGALLIALGIFALVFNLAELTGLTASSWVLILVILTVLLLVGYVISGVRNWPLLFPAVGTGAGALAIVLEETTVQSDTIGGLVMLLVSIPFWLGFLLDRKTNRWAILPAAGLGIVGLALALAGELADELIGALVMLGIAAPFFFVYFNNRKQAWALIPGLILGTIGLIVLFSGLLGEEITGTLVLLAIALPFIILYLLDRAKNVWAVFPAGILISVAVAVFAGQSGLEEQRMGEVMGGIIIAGIGLTFGLFWLALSRIENKRVGRPEIFPIVAMVLVVIGGLVAVFGLRFELVGPLALIALGGWLLFRSLRPQTKG